MKDAHLQRRYKKAAVITVYWEQDGEEGALAVDEVILPTSSGVLVLTSCRLIN